MNTVVARVLRVLTGHSPIALIHAVDKHGHEQKLEVPVEAAREVSAGSVLVLQWSVHVLPEVPGDGTAIEVVPVEETPPAVARPRRCSGVIESSSTNSDAAQLEALLGLRPGRLRGAGPSELP